MAKGFKKSARDGHTWIGVKYSLHIREAVHMELPPAYLAEVRELFKPYCSGRRAMELRAAERLIGKAGIIAYVVPAARPFVSGLHAALAAGKALIRAGRREAPPGNVAPVRYHVAAKWLLALLDGSDDRLFPLRRVVHACEPKRASASGWSAQYDASPWGAGAILVHRGVILEFRHLNWDDGTAAQLEVETGNSKHQSLWELVAGYLTLAVWGAQFVQQSLALIGDNTSALTDALNTKGRGNNGISCTRNRTPASKARMVL